MTQVAATSERIAVLDLARGIAVMGILVINATTFAGPGIASTHPDWHGRAQAVDWMTFGASWLFFEGKMRAIFATLFGASLALFLSRGDPVRRTFDQVRRLLWLAVFGYLHFLLFWWGDILFTYAIAGMIAILFKDLPPAKLLALGIGGLVFVAIGAFVEVWWALDASHAVIAGTAGVEQASVIAEYESATRVRMDEKMAEYAMGFWQAVRYRLTVMPGYPFLLASDAVFEALPLMLCGMGLTKSGFFSGAWPRRTMIAIVGAGALSGLIWYGAMLVYLVEQDFALTLTSLMAYRLGLLGRVAMAASYLALIVLFGGAILRTAIGRRVAAAGRMALSNYLGSTMFMTFLFHGWGLSLARNEYGHATLMGFVVIGWVLMLALSRPWLARFGIGPLELVWRKLAGMGIRKARLAAG